MRVLAPPSRRQVEPLTEPPTFSVVIAAYEAAGTVGEAVRSALEQKVPAKEVIVVDDGSGDHLEEALGPFEDRIRLLRKPNGGGASALNAGARAAEGEFLAILDADDSYDPRRLEALTELAQTRPDLDLITTDAAFIVAGRQVGRFSAFTPFVTTKQRSAIFHTCFVGGWPAVRISRLLAIGGFDERLRTGYDWECWARMILSGSEAGLVDEPYYHYRLHSGTLTSSRSASLWDRVSLLEKVAHTATLTEGERQDLRSALRTHRSRAVVAEAQDALYGEASGMRLLRETIRAGIEPRARVAAATTALAPAIARRLVPEYIPAEERFGKEMT